MTGNIAGVSSYQQTNQIWNASKNGAVEKQGKTSENVKDDTKSSDVKVSEWKSLPSNSALVPTVKEGYGTVIGNATLSDKAKDYYNKLKSKFHGMDFILVSKDVKSQVAANASSYGNAAKPVVLIDDEKIERMANDDSFRKKYEGIIAMSQTKLQEAKNSLVSGGAIVKNYGMSVGSDGKTSFFATVEKANSEQTKTLEKRQAKKKEEKAKAKKLADKKAYEERIEKRRENSNVDKIDKEDAANDKEYIEFKSDDISALINKVNKYAYDNSLQNVKTEEESKLGQYFDFKG